MKLYLLVAIVHTSNLIMRLACMRGKDEHAIRVEQWLAAPTPPPSKSLPLDQSGKAPFPWPQGQGV